MAQRTEQQRVGILKRWRSRKLRILWQQFDREIAAVIRKRGVRAVVACETDLPLDLLDARERLLTAIEQAAQGDYLDDQGIGLHGF